MTQGPVVIAQVVLFPTQGALQVQFAPGVDNPVGAAADVIAACARLIQQEEMQKERKPQIVVPSMVLP